MAIRTGSGTVASSFSCCTGRPSCSTSSGGYGELGTFAAACARHQRSRLATRRSGRRLLGQLGGSGRDGLRGGVPQHCGGGARHRRPRPGPGRRRWRGARADRRSHWTGHAGRGWGSEQYESWRRNRAGEWRCCCSIRRSRRSAQQGGHLPARRSFQTLCTKRKHNEALQQLKLLKLLPLSHGRWQDTEP